MKYLTTLQRKCRFVLDIQFLPCRRKYYSPQGMTCSIKWQLLTLTANYMRTNATAVQVVTLAARTAECLTAIITTCKLPISIESFTVVTYQYMQKLVEGHSEGGNSCASNVSFRPYSAVADTSPSSYP